MTWAIHSPWWALASIPLIVAGVIAMRRRPATLQVSTLRAFKAPAGPGWRHPTRGPVLLHATGIGMMIVALMRPQAGVETQVRRAEGIDIMLALDVSGSMEAYDISESYTTERQVWRDIDGGTLRSRLTIAKEELTRFAESRPDDRIGLVVFARLPYVVCPPTLDHDFLLTSLATVDTGKLPDGTGIAAPVASGTSRLKGSDAKRRVLVLFTDGDNNVEGAVTPVQAAKVAETFEVIIYTVGIGSSRAAMVDRSPFGRALKVGLAGFNEALLRALAETTGGRYLEAKDADGFRQAMEAIDELETTSLEQPVYMDYSERFIPWLLAGLGLVVAGVVLENGWLQSLP